MMSKAERKAQNKFLDKARALPSRWREIPVEGPYLTASERWLYELMESARTYRKPNTRRYYAPGCPAPLAPGAPLPQSQEKSEWERKRITYIRGRVPYAEPFGCGCRKCGCFSTAPGVEGECCCEELCRGADAKTVRRWERRAKRNEALLDSLPKCIVCGVLLKPGKRGPKKWQECTTCSGRRRKREHDARKRAA